jgi:hypothetical protein
MWSNPWVLSGSVTESESPQAVESQVACKENNMEEEPGMVEQGVEQSVVTLMGEIGKHIEGQLQQVQRSGMVPEEEEDSTGNNGPVTSTTVTLDEEDSEKGMGE